MKKLLQLLFSCTLVFSLAGCNSSPKENKPVTQGDLASLLKIEVKAEDKDKVLDQEEVIHQLIDYSGMPKDMIGDSENAYDSLADSLGLINLNEFDPTKQCMSEELDAMMDPINKLKAALEAEKKQPLFLNGMAQPIFPYTSGSMEEGYSNDNSDIIRYCVYVESNYDSDGDGKLDLIKAVVQLPKAAAQGDYKAATIFEARPYIAGCTPYYDVPDEIPGKGKGYDNAKLYQTPEKREVKGEKSTMEHAKNADSKDWYYYSPHEDIYDYEDLTWYDYYLVRGFAVVEAAGPGTRASEGYETCGSDLEIDAFKCVIEWLAGERTAFTDRENNIEIKADWSNGNVGMTGRSYSGTTQFGLASTGVDALKCIVPVAGIASWYEYFKCQGTNIYPYPSDQLTSLALYCAGRYIDQDDWKKIEEDYGAYLHNVLDKTLEHGSAYYDEWENRDYTLNAKNIKAPALIVHGLNDNNVRTKQFELMYNSYNEAGVPVKLLLHQGAHITPADLGANTAIPVGEEQMRYDDLINRWFSHYLYGVDNGIENMPNVMAQSNYDPKVWTTYDTYTSDHAISVKASGEEETVNITTLFKDAGIAPENRDEIMSKQSTVANATYIFPVDQDVTIFGTPHLTLEAAVESGMDVNNLQLSAMLVDIADEEFPSFNPDEDKPWAINKEVTKEKDYWIGGGIEPIDAKEFFTTNKTYKVVSYGWMNLRNPESGFDSKSATNTINPEKGEFHEYNLFLQPNVYTVKKGHKLALVISSLDENASGELEKDYSFDVKTDSIKASIPTLKTNLDVTAKFTR